MRLARALFEMLLALAVAGVMLAVVLPLGIRRGWIVQGSWGGAVLIVVTMLALPAAAIFRPGGPLRRRPD